MNGEVKCLFCRNLIECRDHQYFDCGFSKRLWREVMKKCSLSSIPIGWDEVLRKGMRDWRGKSLKAVICKLALDSSVYNI